MLTFTPLLRSLKRAGLCRQSPCQGGWNKEWWQSCHLFLQTCRCLLSRLRSVKARYACQAPSICVKARDACQAPSICVKARDACQAPSICVKARDAGQAPSICVKARDAGQAPSICVKARDAGQAPSICVKASDAGQAQEESGPYKTPNLSQLLKE